MSKFRKNKAVALKYNAEDDTAPVVIASGYGHVAEKIVDIAEKKGIPVYKDDSAASMLCMLEVGSGIPVEMYEIVAAIYGKLIETSLQIKNEEVHYYRTDRESESVTGSRRAVSTLDISSEKSTEKSAGQRSGKDIDTAKSKGNITSEDSQAKDLGDSTSETERTNDSVRQSVRSRLISARKANDGLK